MTFSNTIDGRKDRIRCQASTQSLTVQCVGVTDGAVRRVRTGAPCCRTPHRKNRKPYTVWYDVGTIKQLALDKGMTQQDLMVMAANDLFKRFDKPPIAI